MEHQFERLTPHIVIMHAEHETDRPILAAIAGQRRTLLLDAGNSPAHARLFREELQRRGLEQPSLLALTHWHWDHSFGMAGWNLPAVAHTETAKALTRLSALEWNEAELARLAAEGVLNEASAEHIRLEYGNAAQVKVVPPDVVFDQRTVLELGGVTCELTHVGGDHADDSCMLYVREDRVLFAGDALGPAVYGGPRRYSSTGFLRLLETIYAYEADWIVESHGVPLSPDDFRRELDPWERLARLVDVFGKDRARVVLELKDYLGLDVLPGELSQGVECFMTGV